MHARRASTNQMKDQLIALFVVKENMGTRLGQSPKILAR